MAADWLAAVLYDRTLRPVLPPLYTPPSGPSSPSLYFFLPFPPCLLPPPSSLVLRLVFYLPPLLPLFVSSPLLSLVCWWPLQPYLSSIPPLLNNRPQHFLHCQKPPCIRLCQVCTYCF